MSPSEQANYVTCPQGHKVYVIWSQQFRRFGFTCEECNQHSFNALSVMTGHLIEVRVVKKLTQRDSSSKLENKQE